MGKGRVGWTRKRSRPSVYRTPHAKLIAGGSCCATQGAQLGTVWRPRGVRWGGGMAGRARGRVIVYLWLIHDFVQQKLASYKVLYSNTNDLERLKIEVCGLTRSRQAVWGCDFPVLLATQPPLLFSYLFKFFHAFRRECFVLFRSY